MNEYLLPLKYQNVGCGISVVIAGLEQTYQDYKKFEISRDDFIYYEVTINENNYDFTNCMTFNELDENRYYIIYAKLTTINDEIIKIDCKILPQVQSATVELSPEMKMRYYLGGGIIKSVFPIEELI